MGERGDRAAQIEKGLTVVRERIEAAVSAAGRDQDPELIVVTKFHPAEDVRTLVKLGVHDVGENRDQEARAKAAETADLPVRWHFIGQLQTNKAKHVVRYATAVHSVDRPGLADALGRAMEREADRRAAEGLEPREPLDCLIQVDLDPREEADRPAGIGTRGGSAPPDVEMLAERVAGIGALRLRGIMAVAPVGIDADRSFTQLAELAARLRGEHPEAMWISAGMSHDLESAVAYGATHLRIGTDVLGPRPAVG